MSSSKRQKIEEYHDPDYCQDESKPKASVSESERLDKIKMIIKREFLKEINSKEEEINLIDHKLNQTKRLLQRVRYAVAMSYYTKKNLVHPTSELKCENNTSEAIGSNIGQQTAIHPSLKKLLGKKPIDYEELMKNRSPRNAAKNARSTLIKPKKKGIKSDKEVPINEMVKVHKNNFCSHLNIDHVLHRKSLATFPQRNQMLKLKKSIGPEVEIKLVI